MTVTLDPCRFTNLLGGTANFIYDGTANDYQGPQQAGLVNGVAYRYRAESFDLSEWEIGKGVYTASTKTFARTTILFSSTGSKVNFSSPPQVTITQDASGDLTVGDYAFFTESNKLLTLTRNATPWAAAGTTSLHICGGDVGEGRIEITSANSDSVVVFGRMNNTFAAPRHLVKDDQMLGLIGVGIDTDGSTTMQQGGAIGGFASQIWTSTHHGFYWQIFGINDNTVDIVNNLTLKNQKAGFGNEAEPQYGITFSLNATAGIASPFGEIGMGLIGADSGGAIAYEAIAFSTTPVVNLYRANNTNASKTALSSGNLIGGFFGNGWDGSAWQVGAGMYAVANQNWSAGVAGTRLDFYVNANGGIASAVALSVSSALVKASADLLWHPVNTATLANGDMQVTASSNTTGSINYRGSDGVLRSFAFVMA